MDKLGINPTYLLTQIINFVILLVILTKLVYKPMLTSLEKRRKKIEEGLALTQRMNEEKEVLESKKKKIVLEAQKEARDIIEKAREAGKKEEQEIIAEANQKAQGVIEKTNKELKAKEKELEAKVSRDAVDIATQLTLRLIGEVLDKNKQEALLKKRLSQFINKK
ncbi:F0F1 ATP synthase subunit B [Candidatus Gottesmanbacteria bacterium]|nr:F0F1 ATP synthase subunit B [Candidatus Gottesmanbacteria bacterium]